MSNQDQNHIIVPIAGVKTRVAAVIEKPLFADPPEAPKTEAPKTEAPKAEEPKVVVPAPTVLDPLLATILSTKRAHNSAGELQFLKWLHDYTKDMWYKPEAMAEGCLVIDNGPSKVMFSCHIDTVHSSQESDGTKQALMYDPAMGHLFLADTKTSGCLGADDGAGIYVMLKMLEAKVPGVYVFHRGEEKGGIGSNAMVLKYSDFFKKFTQCIAFDRKGTGDIIITQGGQPCASPAYGESLSKALAALNLKYTNSHNGSFTDSKVYRHIIPECINLSVGYEDAHSPSEHLNVEHLEALTKAMTLLDWTKLTIARDPKPAYNYGRDLGYEGFPSMNGGKWSANAGRGATTTKGKGKKSKLPDASNMTSLPKREPLPTIYSADDLEYMSYDEIDNWTGDTELTDAITKLILRLSKAEASAETLSRLMGLE